jgi:D-glycerate 3-kinase
LYLNFNDKKVVKFSVDDFYVTYEERKILKQISPFLAYRGPPGTHDTELLLNTIKDLKSDYLLDVELPQFDKSL